MSRWATLEGSVIIHKSKHCSLSKVTDLIFDDYTLSNDSLFDGDCYIHKISIHFEDDGERAWRSVNKFKTHLEKEYNALCELNLTVWL